MHSLTANAAQLSSVIPDLVVKARNVSHSIIQGIHGRKKSGPGETFWQFRKYQNGDPLNQVDWRRSASSSHLYIREKEWEAAHTVWLWADLSPSMAYKSRLSQYTKREKALLLLFAISNLLTQAGERVGLMGLTKPVFGRKTTDLIAEAITAKLLSEHEWQPLPGDVQLSSFSECIIFTDCLEPSEVLLSKLRNLASQGVRGHVVQILDPVEESFPFTGHVEFHDYSSQKKYRMQKAENIKVEYHKKLYDLKSQIGDALKGLNWTFQVYHTDKRETEALLSLYNVVSDGGHKVSPSLYNNREQELEDKDFIGKGNARW